MLGDIVHVAVGTAHKRRLVHTGSAGHQRLHWAVVVRMHHVVVVAVVVVVHIAAVAVEGVGLYSQMPLVEDILQSVLVVPALPVLVEQAAQMLQLLEALVVAGHTSDVEERDYQTQADELLEPPYEDRTHWTQGMAEVDRSQALVQDIQRVLAAVLADHAEVLLNSLLEYLVACNPAAVVVCILLLDVAAEAVKAAVVDLRIQLHQCHLVQSQS